MSDIPDFDLRIAQAIRNLPKLQRELFITCFVDGMSLHEIATRTGLSIRQVKRRTAKALYNVARQMDGHPLRWWKRLF